MVVLQLYKLPICGRIHASRLRASTAVVHLPLIDDGETKRTQPAVGPELCRQGRVIVKDPDWGAHCRLANASHGGHRFGDSRASLQTKQTNVSPHNIGAHCNAFLNRLRHLLNPLHRPRTRGRPRSFASPDGIPFCYRR